MKKFAIYTMVLALSGGALYAVSAAEKAAEAAPAAEAPKEPLVCFESRKGASEITQQEIKPGLLNVKCSPTTGAALWYGDPYHGTAPMAVRLAAEESLDTLSLRRNTEYYLRASRGSDERQDLSALCHQHAAGHGGEDRAGLPD